MSIAEFDEIIEPNDQTEARKASLDALRELVGNVYPNKFDRSKVSGTEDTITNILRFVPVVEIVNEIKAVVATLAERERPPAEIKDALNARLKEFGSVRIAGRLTTPPRGNFVHLTDGINKLQIYCNKKGPLALVLNDGKGTLDEENGWAAWQLLDHGDFVGVEGYLFITNTGELSVHVEKLQFLAKAMLPMPDKMHGIEDPEIKQRRRYVDLIGSSLQIKAEPPASAGAFLLPDAEKNPPAHAGGSDLSTREVFERRAKVISSFRHFLEDHGYIEVETPMLTPKATGAAAKPFKTHHNALDIDLYARIAPELYLKRLVVGGFEKVYELNRNFRNEGISYKHNPEFTMLEFYCAYMDVEGMMNFCEEMLREGVQKATGGTSIEYDRMDWKVEIDVNELRTSTRFASGPKKIKVLIDFSNFEYISMRDSIIRQWNLEFAGATDNTFQQEWFDAPSFLGVIDQYLRYFYEHDTSLKTVLRHQIEHQFERNRLMNMSLDVALENAERQKIDGQEKILEEHRNKWAELTSNCTSAPSQDETGPLLAKVFELLVESDLIQPTFIIDYPKSISPLSKASPENPAIAERFELFINGMEVANGFSELNDPKEQYERFVDQMSERERGDEEAMILDEDYIRALSYGMPPAAGIGIGIDRLVMLLTNKHSIRDVILFPHMRPERNSATEDTE